METSKKEKLQRQKKKGCSSQDSGGPLFWFFAVFSGMGA
jgi:hypothetical protein